MLTFSLSYHALALILSFEPELSTVYQLHQIQVLVIAAFLCSLVSSLIPLRTVIVYSYIFRAAFIAVTIALLQGRALALEIVLLMSFILEAPTSLPWFGGFFIASLTFSFATLSDFLHLLPGGLILSIDHSAAILVISIPILVLTARASQNSNILQANREQIVALNLAIENLENANRAFQNYAETIRSLSTEQERKRITRELHDMIGYALTNIIMLMNAGKVLILQNPAGLEEILEHAKQQADSALRDSRRTLYQLRAIATNEPTGLRAMHELVRAFSEATGIRVDFHYGNLPNSYNESIDIVIYRIIQEGLTNILKHADAQRITISLWQTEREISVSVRDDGGGSSEIKEGIGLKGMRERLARLGGTLKVRSEPYGFALTALIPVDRAINEDEGDGNHQNSHR
jgi:signal transduction histidine kinase